jgi:hypothetical protein
MKRLFMGVLLVALLTVFGLASSGDAASPFNCTGINSGPINSNVNVPNGARCSLDGATVTGRVTVQAGGGLVIIHGSTISGDVTSTSGPAADFQAETTFGPGYPSYNGSIWICGSTVKGPVNVANASNQLTIGAPDSGYFMDQYNHCPGSKVGGSVTATGVQGGVEVVNSSIGGYVRINNTNGCPNDEFGCNDGNSPPAASVEVTGSTISGNLTCTNSQFGLDVHDNTVRGRTDCSS